MLKKTIIGIGSIIGVLASGIAIVDYYNDKSLIDLNGQWIITDTIETGKYKNTTIGFQVFITQDGKNFTGEGEKITLNGKNVIQKEKSRLELVAGTIQSNIIRATFIEHGRKRETRGEFIWKKIEKKKLSGEFISTANSRGKSIAIKK